MFVVFSWCAGLGSESVVISYDFTSDDAAAVALGGHDAPALLLPQLVQRLGHELLVDPAEVGHVTLALLVAVHVAY